ncbi:Rab family, other [Trypanosoma rangeli]|uniref:Rab family, other n=1 Tax=Trypanosoma rangeli TaxID=5698 RepID=A0A3R7MSK5_TRYRA|nr:Rab family, other [Trypanosoma rangeli]RNF10551.1 Rab family, other [Trypanosoma rangeli]|eukprot:RNF10551.1 Rab family, other [Trypanosoma rangeli]
MSEEKVKILVLGPSKSGKSTIANFLAGIRDTPTKEYYETNPLRVLEVEIGLDNLQVGGRHVAGPKRAIVQLWDLGGSSKHQAGWLAVAANADGIIYVFNPEVRGSEKELLLWYKKFALDQDKLDESNNFKMRVSDKHSLVFSHHSSMPELAVGDNAIPALPKQLRGVRAIETSLDYQSSNFKEAFDAMVEQIILSRILAEEDELLRKEREAGDVPRVVR